LSYSKLKEFDLMSFHTMERFGAALTLSQCKGFNLGRGHPSLPTCICSGNAGGSGGCPEFFHFRLGGDVLGGGGGGGGDIGTVVALTIWCFAPLVELPADFLAFDTVYAMVVPEAEASV
jgi:hypothetical protein